MNIRQKKGRKWGKDVWSAPEPSARPENGSLPDYRRYRLSLREGAQVLVGGGLMILGLAWLFYRDLRFGLLLSPLLWILWKREVRRLQERRQKLLRRQFRDAMQALAAALRAGFAVEGGLAQAEKELRKVYGDEGLLVEEFAGIRHQLQMNRTVEAGFLHLAERSGLPEIREMAQVLALAKRSGGKLPEILQRTAGTLEAKGQLEEELLALTAAKRMELQLMCLMPAGILFYVGVTSPDFLEPLYQGIQGRFLMSACLLFYGLAVWMGEKMMKKMKV